MALNTGDPVETNCLTSQIKSHFHLLLFDKPCYLTSVLNEKILNFNCTKCCQFKNNAAILGLENRLFLQSCRKSSAFWFLELTYCICKLCVLQHPEPHVNDSQVRLDLFTQECGCYSLSAHHSSGTITLKSQQTVHFISS